MEGGGQRDIEISIKNSSILILFNGVKELLCYFLNLNIKQFDKEKNQNDPDTGLFNLYAWKSFLSLKIQKKYLDTNKAKKYAEQISEQIPNELDQLLLAMTECWTLSELVPFYKITSEGLSQFVDS